MERAARDLLVENRQHFWCHLRFGKIHGSQTAGVYTECLETGKRQNPLWAKTVTYRRGSEWPFRCLDFLGLKMDCAFSKGGRLLMSFVSNISVAGDHSGLFWWGTPADWWQVLAYSEKLLLCLQGRGQKGQAMQAFLGAAHIYLQDQRKYKKHQLLPLPEKEDWDVCSYFDWLDIWWKQKLRLKAVYFAHSLDLFLDALASLRPILEIN